jgi:murein DD-endopeptidase MepM/ murein hydrolase activator NlpD
MPARMWLPLRALFLLFAFVLCAASLLVLHVRAQGVASSTASQADQVSTQISQLQQEILQLQTQLNATTQQKQTLQNAVAGLNLNIQKITASIALTQAQISQADSQIGTLSNTISTTTNGISQSQSAIADSLQQLAMLDNEPLITVLLGGGTLSSFFDQANALAAVRDDLENHITYLSSLKTTLETSKSAAEQKRAALAALEQNLSEQKQGLAIARNSQTQLLAQTKDQESNYQALIAQKEAQERQFEAQLLSAGSQLNLTVNPLNLPAPGPVLAWPVDNTAITQYFGNTAFATQNPQVYNGHGHDGIDLRASPGTPVHAALAGVVVGTGNTDLTCPGASFGKWIFIQHANGLSTIYAHLSTILVSVGQQVNTSDLIAYSDTTGYAIGPHLHFGVYATAGTVIEQLPTALKCKLVIPVATLSAYLNPLTYLPPLGR